MSDITSSEIDAKASFAIRLIAVIFIGGFASAGVFNALCVKGNSVIQQDKTRHINVISAIKRAYNKSYYTRLDFLMTNCRVIEGYEVLNDGKTTFRCPNGKEYMMEMLREKI